MADRGIHTEPLDAAAAERVVQMLAVMKVGFEARPDEVLVPNERIARDAMRRVIDLVEEALRGW